MASNKYLDEIAESLQPSPLFNNQLNFLDPQLAEKMKEHADWDLVDKVLPDFYPLVLSDGLIEALDVFHYAYGEQLEADAYQGDFTRLALHLVGQSMIDPHIN